MQPRKTGFGHVSHIERLKIISKILQFDLIKLKTVKYKKNIQRKELLIGIFNRGDNVTIILYRKEEVIGSDPRVTFTTA